jgi:hypothetical protein
MKIEFPFSGDEYVGHLHVDGNSSESLDAALHIHQSLHERGLFITTCFVEGANPPELVLTAGAEQKVGVPSLIGAEAILASFN